MVVQTTAISNQTASQSASVTNYIPIAGIALFDSTETNSQVRFPTGSVTWQNLYVRVSANNRSDSTTVRSRKNTANGNMVVTIAASTTGEFRDIVNTDSLAAGDDIAYSQTTGGGSGSITTRIFSSTFEHASICVQPFRADSTIAPAGAQTIYLNVNGQHDTVQTTETTLGIKWDARHAGTWRRLQIRITANSIGNGSTLTSRINGANGTQTVSVSKGATGFFEDATNTDTVAANDDLNISFAITGMSNQSITIAWYGSGFENSDSRAPKFTWMNSLYANDPSVSAGQIRYTACAGYRVNEITESNTRLEIVGQNITASRLHTLIAANSRNGASTIELRKNDGRANQSISISAAATGNFENTINSDDLKTTDEVFYLLDGGSGTGSLEFAICSMQLMIIIPRELSLLGAGR